MAAGTEDRAEEILRRLERMQTDRSVFEDHWREIAERVLPRSNWFQVSRSAGAKNSDKVFDATAGLALERFAAAMESMLTPRTQRWHRLRASDPSLAQSVDVQQWLDEVTGLLFDVRYAPRANFASQVNECYMSLGAFGTGGVFVDDALGRGVRYRAIHLSELFIAENHQGMIDTVYRKFQMTARQAAQKWPASKLPTEITTAAEKFPDRDFEFVHAVQPNSDKKPGRRDYRGMNFYSCYISLTGHQILSEGGYRTMPYAIGRYVVGPKEIYGRSPAMTVLADVKMLNEMSKTVIRAAHKIVDPPLLLQEDGALQAFDLRPGALNYGGVSDAGHQVVLPLQTNARVDIGLEMMEQRRRVINDAFLVTLFQILVEKPYMTATEAMLRAQEKGALLAPSMGRQQSEFLGPLIEREIDILSMADALPPMPDELRNAGGMVDVEYVSPLNRAQRADEGMAILRTIESVAPLAQIDPGVLDVFNPEAIVRELAEINGVPMKVLRSREEIQLMKEQKNQAAQAQQLLQAAPVVGEVAKNMAQAQAIAGASSMDRPVQATG